MVKSRLPKKRKSTPNRPRGGLQADEELARLAKAIGHPLRLQIVRILAEQTTCVCGELVGELPVAQSTVSQHLKVLKDAGLIRGTVDGPRVCYCLDTDMLDRLKTLVNDLPTAQAARAIASDPKACG